MTGDLSTAARLVGSGAAAPTYDEMVRWLLERGILTVRVDREQTVVWVGYPNGSFGRAAAGSLVHALARLCVLVAAGEGS